MREYTFKMQVTATIDDIHNIEFITVMAISINEGISSEWSFNASNLSPVSENEYSINYRPDGSAVCNYVTSIYAKYTQPDGYKSELNERECDKNCYLEIKFHNWD